ncbi:MAG TPA: ATP-binding protein [Ktedonobacteraceae bacterium]|nr:ATP-binding protein [Ktedonobacteraceae bacterium]
MTVFPLSAMVGQPRMRLALVLNAIDPLIGGVLICGRRGTGKSTMARALSSLLPPIAGVADCPYFCDVAAPQAMCSECHRRFIDGESLPIVHHQTPFVTLPLNASEDRVAGSIDVSATLQSGSYHFAPGLLASANRGLLYVDEINLLNDQIADILLDAAALGMHRVACDGIAIAHPARFVLVGTMNPEEGQLRPQLLDRIGLYVETEDLREQATRMSVVERRLAFDSDPAAFAAQWADAEQALRARIEEARRVLPEVRISRYFRMVVAHLVGRELHAQGHRGDIVVVRTARALAAWEQRQEVQQADIELAILLAMPHRSRPGASLLQQLARAQEQLPAGGTDSEQPQDLGTIDDDLDERTNEREGPAGLSHPLRGALDAAQVQRLITIPRDRLTRHESGRRFVSLTSRRSGRYIRDRQAHPVTDIAFSATIRAAAPYQQARGRTSGEKLELRASDLRQKVRERKTRALLIFVVDGSDSVMARQLMPQTKRLLLALLQTAYEKRDRVAMLVFRFAQGRVVLPPTRNFAHARRSVEELYVGGCTPLATGLLEGLRLAETERLRDPTTAPVLVVLTDGLANIDLAGNMRSITPRRDALSVAHEIAARRIPAVMIDTTIKAASNPFAGEGPLAQLPVQDEGISPAKELALALCADYYQLSPPDRRGGLTTTLLKRG